MSFYQVPMFSINDLVLIITLVECFILAGYTLLSESKKSPKSFLFCLFLLVTVVEITTNLVMWNRVIPMSNAFKLNALPYLYMFSQLVKGPTLLLFIQASTETDFKLRKRFLTHVLPAAFVLSLIFFLDITTPRMNSYQFVWFNTSVFSVTSSLMFYFVNLIAVGYVLFTQIIIKRYHRRLQEYYSSFSTVELNWLLVMCICFTLGWSWYLVMAAVADHIGGSTADLIGSLYNYLVFVLINILFVYTFFYSRNKLSSKPFVEKVREKNDYSEQDVIKVEEGISKLNLHLEANINIEEFSRKVGLPNKTVSLILNKRLKTKFFEFINTHRVEEAKRLLADPALNHYNVMDILLMAGFNNKSSFHRFFNRSVEISPSEYRKRMQVEEKSIASIQ